MYGYHVISFGCKGILHHGRGQDVQKGPTRALKHDVLVEIASCLDHKRADGISQPTRIATGAHTMQTMG